MCPKLKRLPKSLGPMAIPLCRLEFRPIDTCENKFARNVLKRCKEKKKRASERAIITPLSRAVIMQVTKQILYHLLSFLTNVRFMLFVHFFHRKRTTSTPSTFFSDHKNRRWMAFSVHLMISFYYWINTVMLSEAEATTKRFFSIINIDLCVKSANGDLCLCQEKEKKNKS